MVPCLLTYLQSALRVTMGWREIKSAHSPGLGKLSATVITFTHFQHALFNFSLGRFGRVRSTSCCDSRYPCGPRETPCASQKMGEARQNKLRGDLANANWLETEQPGTRTFIPNGRVSTSCRASSNIQNWRLNSGIIGRIQRRPIMPSIGRQTR